MRGTHGIGIALIGLMIGAASCASTDDAGSGTSAPAATAEVLAADQTAPSSLPASTAQPAPLTASFRGVTPEVIKVGVVSFDWDALSAMGVRFGRTNSEDIYIAALEAINDRGGIHGRMLELHSKNFLPVGEVDADTACLELTEDEEVFVVVGVTLGDQIRCFTERHETAAVVVGGMTEETKAAARAPYATVSNETQERSAAFLAALEDLGVVDGKKIGATGSLDVSEDAYNFTVEAFEDAGYDTVGGLSGDNNEDLEASASESSITYERFRTEGVEVAVSTTGVPLAMVNAVNAGYEPDLWTLLVAMTARGLRDAGVDPNYLDGAYSVHLTRLGTSLQPAMADDPVVRTCVDDIEQRTGRTISYALEVETSDLAGVLAACSFAAILEAGLTNAGPDLTNESFQRGLESIGPIDLAGYPNAELGPGDLSATSDFLPTRFNAATEQWVPVEESN